jgi:hypothetical protein
VQDIANEFNMPRYGFYPTTHYLSLIFSLPDFYKKGFLSIFSNNQPLKIPGFPPILPCDLPKSVLDNNQKRVYEGERLREAAGVLVNSAYELESSIFDGLHDMICKVQEQDQVINSIFLKLRIGQFVITQLIESHIFLSKIFHPISSLNVKWHIVFVL